MNSSEMIIYFILGMFLLFVAVYLRKVLEENRLLRKDMEYLSERVARVEKHYDDEKENLDKMYASMKDVIFERLNLLTANTNDFGKVIKKNEEKIRGLIQKNVRELERVAKENYTFAKDIEKMKDFIRERTTDLEL